jgi:MarR-like DNA-binding transcriptional regulator SgrR of sgrS sRNA
MGWCTNSRCGRGLTFHNGDPFSAEDVRFSFLRYKGTSAKLLHEQVQAVEIIDALFQQQAVERDRTKPEALLHQLQRLMQERVMHAPIAEPAALHGVGPRVEELGIGLIPLFAYFGPYEEMRLKGPERHSQHG